MPANEIHKDDIGTIFTITVYDGSSVADISTATDKRIIFKQPDGNSLTVSGSFYTNGTDGKLTYTTVTGDLSVDGRWRIQAYLTFPSGKFKSDIGVFRVHDNL